MIGEMKTIIEKQKAFFGNLDERQRRLYAGIEAIRLGWHGVEIVSEQFGMHPVTIRKGKKELELSITKNRLRQVGGGRKKKFKLA